ncbi:MAG TPA: hypothetical protein PL155_05000 [Candidatus Omnitrophota bacterium]|nr:hypothetical protein [Candidatus Omnitrophota bacterium]HPD84163.1 hypothetical protein [Candidatus Omnitrophota bacterium]HRZ03020.1 hypothetical protein [Candidatus Omnitrophota bacterium]
MTPRKNDSQARKDRVLAIVVDQYIKNVTPVGSSFIVQEYHLDLSPATVRNILAELEEEGFLSHPHTSAGRVPTQRGYRYFVDHLMNEIQLLKEEKERIQAEYRRGVKELEKLLEKTSEVISDLTHYTSIVSIDGGEKMFCKGISFVAGYPEFHNFERIKHIIHALEEKEHILEVINRALEKKIQIFIGSEIACEDIEGCSLAISSFKKENGPSGRIAVLGPTRMDYERVVSTLDYFSKLMKEIL